MPFESRPPLSASTLVELLLERAAKGPDQPAYTFLADGEAPSAEFTYSELDRRARAIAAWLQHLDAAGERALLLYPPGLDYIAALFGCFYAGVVAVPAYPPRLNRPMPRLRAIVADSGARVALTQASILENIQRRFEHAPELQALRWLDTDQTPTQAHEWRDPAIPPSMLAFLQYTSGSTGAPKGVMLSHANLMSNLEVIRHGFQIDAHGRGAFWLPSYHDMGLIGGVLEPLYIGGRSVLMSPASFLQRPIRWLQAFARYGATISGAPNFAYDLCVERIPPEARAELDLSGWKLAFCGAEPVRPETLERFVEAFAPCGFRREALYPCYGLAEATLLVSGGLGPSAPTVSWIRKSDLRHHRVVPVAAEDTDAQSAVGCGQALLDTRVAIVDPDTEVGCASEQVGEVWVSGPSVAQGYWNRPNETQQSFGAIRKDTGEGPFLRTGDLGFVRDGQLFITGRIKDLIIIRGRNHYPHDIERTVALSHPALQPDAGAAFSIDADGGERLVVVQELRRQARQPEFAEVTGAVRQAVAEAHEVQLDALVLVKPLSVPKTSSGKIQRHACRAGYLDGTLEVVTEWHATRPHRASPSGVDSRLAPAIANEPSRGQSVSMAPSAAAIAAWLVDQIAARTGTDPASVDPDQPFTYYGLDSVQAVAIAGELETWLGRRLPPTLAWDYPTVALLASHLAGADGESQSAAQQPSARPATLSDEPIAIIGLGCRFPGADGPEAFWRLLHDGVDAIREVPPDRWNNDAYYHPDAAVPGKLNTRWGGFLEGIDGFDAAFFGISPREAAGMDPQQRLLLETAWQALEHAGLVPERLAGTRTGVFVGISSYDYSRFQFADASLVDAYAGTGNAHSVAANRLSYLLDLRGPSLAVDTACSSSLVATHLACRSLRQGETDLAIAGGVNVILSPELTITFSQARMMAADGRCKTFDARADGYVRGEGVGVVVLKRLADAQRDGDHVLAVIRGSAVNQDGRSNGLTAPNGPAQQAVIRQALADAGVAPEQIGYVEAHGTGTPLGDPIEVQALAAVLGPERVPDQACLIGSVKTNVGHLEAAAGVAGLIKTVLSLTHEEIPPHLHLQQLNPHIVLDGAGLDVVRQRRPWRRGERPRLAGVSSFGFGGTNAHVVLEEAPLSVEAQAPQFVREVHVLALSAKSSTALAEMASRYADRLEAVSDEAVTSINVEAGLEVVGLADVCHSANTGRSHFAHRLAVAAASSEQMRQALHDFALGRPSASAFSGQVHGRQRPKVAFLFTGQGSQYVGMARQLYETQPVFRRTLDHCAERLASRLSQPLLSVLYPADGTRSPLDQTAFTQPALFAIEVALAELWRSWGVLPDAVIGHSVGEYSAAVVAGALRLEDGLALIAERARLMQALPDGGAMAAVFAGEERVAAALESAPGDVVIAGLNGPDSTVISGEAQAVRAVLGRLTAEGISSQPLSVSHAFHSPLLEPMLDAFEQAAAAITAQAPRLPLISNLTGQPFADGVAPDAAYWRRHARQPVRFAEGIRALSDIGCDVFLEIGPSPVLIGMGRRCLPDHADLEWLPSLKGGQADWQVLLSSLGRLYVRGVEPDWQGVDYGFAHRKVSVPAYPFERERYWIDGAEASARLAGPAEGRPEPSLPQEGLGPRQGDLRAALRVLEAAGEQELAKLGVRLERVDGAAPSAEESPQVSPGSEASLSREALMDLSTEERQARLEHYLLSRVGRVLRLPRSRLQAHQALDGLGLDSLMAIELKNGLEAEVGVVLPLAWLLQGPTVASLAAQVLELMETPGAPTTELTVGEPLGDHPLSYGQQALWFLHQLLPPDIGLNVAGAVRVRGRLDPSALQRALRALVERHASLRTTFVTKEGRPVQQVHAQLDVKVDEQDASGWSQTALHVRLTRDAHRPFDLERESPVRLVLYTRAADERILLLSIDHMVADFWSVAVLVHDLLALYRAQVAGSSASLVALPVQYTDYVRWQAEALAGPEGERLWAYWRDRLAGELPVLDLPTDRPRPSHQTYRTGSLAFRLDADVTRSLKALGETHAATLYTTLLAAFQAWLHRYTGQDDLLVGSVVAGRNRAELAGLVGYFINPVALRADCSGNPTFVDFLARVRQTVLGAIDHQDFPPALLAERLHLPRDPSRPPLFQSMFILQKSPVLDEGGFSALALGQGGASVSVGDLAFESVEVGRPIDQFDVTLMMAEAGGVLAGSLQYNAALFDAATAARMLEHFQNLLRGIAAEPMQRLSALPLLSQAEHRQLLIEWNATAHDWPANECLHHLVQAQAARKPGAPAVAFGDQALTYAELDHRGNRLAHHLRTLGVGPGSIVGLCLERGLDMVVGLLGILKAGGAYLPLDPAYPDERVAFMLADSGAKVLVTRSHGLGVRAWGIEGQPLTSNPQPLLVYLDRETFDAYPSAAPAVPLAPDDLAYVIYTSGSTGRPKGVMVPHGAAVNFLHAMRQRPGMTEDDALLAVTTLSFDIAALEIFLPLSVGAQVVIASREQASDGLWLAERLSQGDIGVMQATPATWQLLLEAGWLAGPASGQGLGFTALCGGEALPRELAERLVERCTAVWNMYGPTETTIWSTCGRVESGDGPVPVGRPIANTQVYIVDDHMQPVPLGVVGELVIGGRGVARGYVHRPELTAERFVPDPFGPTSQARLYRTGDLARYRADGSLEIVGRRDQQVKLRGYRIELGEIEAALASHPAVRQAVVVAREDRGWSSKRLVAYVVLEGDSDIGAVAADAKAHLSRTLPEYMLPSAFVQLPAFPLTANGKVDRRALPAPEPIQAEARAEFVAPRTPLEAQVASLCAETLGVEHVGVLDNFFDLGGNSLLATQLVFRVREATGTRVPLRALFEVPSVDGLARAVEAARRVAQGLDEPADSAMARFGSMTVAQLNAEVSLDPTVAADGLPRSRTDQAEHVLLTGATGFVGAFLLHDLLSQTSARVHCLVRAPDADTALGRIRKNLESYGLWQPELAARIVPLLGDLALPRLGLSKAAFERLAVTMDAIYHNGALVNLVYPYHAHKAANVQGTHEVLRLASRVKLKPVHYVSTLSVFHTARHRADHVFHEGDDLDQVGAPFGGYPQSKWVAEKVVALAQARGLPVSVYRLGLVSGSSRTGAWNTDDFVCSLTKACLLLGRVPDLDVMADLVPVDYVSGAIVHLSRRPETIGKVFHLANPSPLRFADLVAWAGGRGYALECVPFERWRSEMFNYAPLLQGTAWESFLGLIEELDEQQAFLPRFDCQAALHGLAGSGIACPPVGPELLETYFGYFLDSGFLGTPSGNGRAA